MESNLTDWCCSLLVSTPIAHAISGLFVFSAIIIACFQVGRHLKAYTKKPSFYFILFQVFQHLRYYTVPEQQLWIVRILFIIPVYGFCSWLGILFPKYSVYFDAIRSCYEGLFICFFKKLFDLFLQLLSFITSFVSVSRIWEESRPSWLLLAGLLYRMKGREGGRGLKVGGAREG